MTVKIYMARADMPKLRSILSESPIKVGGKLVYYPSPRVGHDYEVSLDGNEMNLVESFNAHQPEPQTVEISGTSTSSSKTLLKG